MPWWQCAWLYVLATCFQALSLTQLSTLKSSVLDLHAVRSSKEKDTAAQKTADYSAMEEDIKKSHRMYRRKTLAVDIHNDLKITQKRWKGVQSSLRHGKEKCLTTHR